MLKNIIKVMSSNLVLVVIGFLNSIIFPLILSIEDYAYYQEFMLYLSYTNICHLGIASGMFLNYAGKQYKDIDKKQYKSEMLLLFMVLSFFSVLGMVFSAVFREDIFLLVTVSIFPYCFIASYQALLQAWERFTAYSLLNMMPKLMFFVIIIIVYCISRCVSGLMAILSYLTIIWIITLWLLSEYYLFTKKIKPAKIFSKMNLQIGKEGFLITLGNYVNLILHSIDKQFVELFYDTKTFATYSFVMSLQNIMLVFIMALANPFYPRLAKGDIDEKYIERFKSILFIFGSFSGCAYFVISFFIKHFAIKYESGNSVIAIFFAVFPAMAVINVIYINLYKIRKQLKKYISTLILILSITILLNGVVVFFEMKYEWIAFATMLTYYIWLFYSQRHFKEIRICAKDYIFLVGFFAVYFSLVKVENDIVGLLLYTILIVLWGFFVYKEHVIYVFRQWFKYK